jgi:GntR family transcriptional regulator
MADTDGARHGLRPEGPIPLYFQLEQALQVRIAAGEFQPGKALPTEEQICSEYGISRITVRRALQGLHAQGAITRRRGVGSFVAPQYHGMRPRLTGSLDEFLTTAAQLRVQALAFGLTEVTPDVADHLQLTPGSPAWRAETLGTLNDEGPVAYLEMWFPPDVGALLEAGGLGQGQPVIRIVERMLGVRIFRAEQMVEAGYAGAAAPHLGIGAETPILRVRRVYFTEAERPVELAYVCYHPERYKYAVTFTR